MVKNKSFEFGGEQLKRVLPGYDKENPRGDLLRYKGLRIKSSRLDLNTLSSPSLVDICAANAHIMGPVHRWFVEVNQSIS